MKDMRTTRFISLAAVALLYAIPADAQQRLFRDSWFWGVKGGIMTVSARSGANVQSEMAVAPTIGAEWLITRTQGALYAAFDQALFTATSFVPDASQPSLERQVKIENLRRFTLGLMAFPKQFGAVRPYVGAGVGITVTGSAIAQGTFSDASAQSAVTAAVNERKSGAAPTLIGGVHVDTRRISFFGQASVITFTDRFLINGTAPIALEAGIRYNLAPAKERPRQR